MMTDTKANMVFESIIGKRFENEKEISKWIREFTKCNLKGLWIGELQHPQDKDEDCELDDFMDCTFGENECDRDYADFILYAIKTNANELYITEAGWMY